MHTHFAVLEFAETSYSVYENATIVMICVNLVSGVNSVINGTIRTLSREAVGMYLIHFLSPFLAASSFLPFNTLAKNVH